ncbi:bifunctional adenosylcobinamide kinase/adenosylcobinamide-phosphate guanylyltransferase [Dyadobacter tibetensis]|uniref:bifunctional adenosylcobinamide kinase/adenosylcobinamide-phosphate guanylyltransferase n=1 Tax=Dyadobacter tibetensis TaxID=1211851 RepID=UPI0004728893|nr:bifunctional adenosylcobinamide kinase/adenosylcobinamide-phosphate guanylyltransferase [Dyadobacter tibetensis]
MIIYISGGARSGKSAHAQTLALALSPAPVYVATARIWDEDFAERVIRHRQERGPEWTLFEQETDLHTLPLAGRVVVIDCVTLWLTNLLMQTEENIDACLLKFKAEIDGLLALEGTYIIISNELGMGMHPETSLGRKFVDLQGWANQYVAQKAEKAVFLVSGIPITIK